MSVRHRKKIEMRRRLSVDAIYVVLVLVLTGGCSGDDRPTVSGNGSADGECVQAWNDDANRPNHDTVAEGAGQWRVVVSRWNVDHPAEGLTGEGCSYFFFDDDLWASFSGAWAADGDLRWGIPPTQRGPRRPEQQIREPNADLQDDGTLR